MKSTTACLALTTLATLSCVSALAETDRKIVSGNVCQPEHPSGAAHLRYLARGVVAVDEDVSVTCPLLRDSTLSSLSWVQVSYSRGLAMPPVNTPHSQFVGAFKGTLLSCSEMEINDPCAEVSKESAKTLNQEVRQTIPIVFDNPNLPKGADRSYSFKTKLPKGTVLKSITYKELVN